LDSDGDEFLRILHSSAQRMLGLVQSLTVYSHAIHSDDDHKPVDVELVLDQAIARCRTLIDETEAVITRSPMPFVLGNESQLAQVFESLLRNSLIYRGERPPVIDVRAEQSSEAWRFSVHDNGIGIDQEHHERVFGLFKRLHGSKYPGTGLGLALCRRIVQRHGGGIYLSSGVGQSSIFSFTVSASASDKGTARADAAASR
jgi:signal transduction histidine kinase